MKIALVHHCSCNTYSMTDKGWWFNLDYLCENFEEGMFVVTESKMPKSQNNLCIGWIETIKENENENPTSFVVGAIFPKENIPKPIFDSEMGQEDDFDEESA